MNKSNHRFAAIIPACCLMLVACGGSGGGGGTITGPAYTIGGTVSGLQGTGLVLAVNGSAALSVTANGLFNFSATFTGGTTYTVTVTSQPSNPAQTCLVTNGAGTLASNVSNVFVSCGLSGRFAYVANNGLNNINSVSGYQIHPSTGLLTPIAGTPIAAGHTPQAIVATPNGSFLYAANFPGPVVGSFSVYSINAGNGSLTPIAGSPFSTATSAINMTVTPNGARLVTADFGTQSVSVYSLNAATGAPSHLGTTPLASGARSVVVSPNGQFVYVGVIIGTINGYTLNAATGALTPLSGSPINVMSGFVYNMAIDPTGKFLFVLHSSGILVYALNATTGAMTAVTGNPFTAPGAIEGAAVHPNGNFLYVVNDSMAPEAWVLAYSINPTTGALTQVPGSPFPTLDRPFRVAVDPSGAFAYVTSGITNTISVFAINSATGALTPTGSPTQNGVDTVPAGIAIVR